MLRKLHKFIPLRALKGYGFGRAAADAKNALKGAGFSQPVQSSQSFRALAPEGSECIPTGVDDSRSESSAEWRDLLFSRPSQHLLSTFLKLVIVFVLGLSLQFVAAQDKGIRWTSIDPFCGQITSAEPKEFPIEAAKVLEIKPSTRTVERTIVTSTDLIKNAQTH